MTLLNLDFSVPNPEVQLDSSTQFNIDKNNDEDNLDSEVPLTEQELWLKDMKSARAEWNLLNPAPPESESLKIEVIKSPFEQAKSKWREATSKRKQILVELDYEVLQARKEMDSFR